MSNINNTFKRGLRLYGAGNVNIPYPQVIASGINTAGVDRIRDTNVDFIALNVQPGDVVYNTTGSAVSTVVRVVSNNELLLEGSTFPSTGQSYTLYQQSSQSTIGNQGCVFMLGDDDTVTVETVGGDVIQLPLLKAGTVVPIQIKKLLVATVDSHIALW